MKIKKRYILMIAIVGMVIYGVVTVFQIKNNLPPTITMSNGDEVVINEVAYTTVWNGDSIDIYTVEDYENAFSTKDGLGADVTIPMDVENMVHLYQVKAGSKKIHDEVYLWETKVYENPETVVIEASRNVGIKRLLADRGYVELTICQEENPLRNSEILFSEDLEFAKSYLNGKTVIVKKILDASETNRNTYEATIKDIDGNGFNAFVVADNVDEAYFLRLLEIITGTESSFDGVKYSTEPSTGVTKEELEVAATELAIENTAQKIIDDAIKEEIRSGDISFFMYHMYPDYNEDIVVENGIFYNVSCQYYVRYTGEEFHDMLSATVSRYFCIETDTEGNYIEASVPFAMIVNEEADLPIGNEKKPLSYTMPEHYPFEVQVQKSDVAGQTLEQITTNLLKKMIEDMCTFHGDASGDNLSYKYTGNRTFRIADYNNLQIRNISDIGNNKFQVTGSFDWNYKGYTSEYGYRGNAFIGVDGIPNSWSPITSINYHLILTKTEDGYILKTNQ